jgi:hypothetical protein
MREIISNSLFTSSTTKTFDMVVSSLVVVYLLIAILTEAIAGWVK